MREWFRSYWPSIRVYGLIAAVIFGAAFLLGWSALPIIVGLAVFTLVGFFVGSLAESKKSGFTAGAISGVAASAITYSIMSLLS